MKMFSFLKNIILLYSLFIIDKNATSDEELRKKITNIINELEQNTNPSEQTEEQPGKNCSANTLKQKIQPPDYLERIEIDTLKRIDEFNKLPHKKDLEYLAIIRKARAEKEAKIAAEKKAYIE
jgi:hypothetical protein